MYKPWGGEMGTTCNIYKGCDTRGIVGMVKIKGDEMVGAYSTCEGDEKFV
jgi:hypothetical protein